MTKTASDRCLGSVSIPCLSSDLPALRRTFKLWSDPRFFPLATADGLPKPTLLVVFNRADAALIAETQALWEEFPKLGECFEACAVFSADLEGDRDIYARGAPFAEGAFGNKAGPNFLFQETMHIARQYGLYTFQAELDCLPLRSNWLHALERMLASSDAWVIGAPYLGDRRMDASIQFHINGNALYRCGSPHFQTFLDDVWIRNVVALAKVHPNLAYDCWWALQMARSNADADSAAWHLWQDYCFFFQYSAFVINLTVGDDQCTKYIDVFRSLEAKGVRPLFMHGGIMNQVAELLCVHKQMTVHQALVELEEANFRKRKAEMTENTSPAYQFVARVAQRHEVASPPRLLLGKGFYKTEGPAERYFPTRYAWTGDTRLELSVTDARQDLRLFFREGQGRSFHDHGTLDLRVFKLGQPVPSTCEVLEDPSFACLHVRREDLGGPGLIEIETGLETYAEQGASKRTLGILVFEIGFRMGSARLPSG